MSDELREIADQLRQIPLELERQQLLRDDAATYAGRLLLEAIASGLFSGSQWLGLRHKIEMARQGELACQLGHTPGTRSAKGSVSPHPPWHVFLNGCVLLLTERGEPIAPFDTEFVTKGCALIVEHLDVHLQKLEDQVDSVEPLPQNDEERWLRFVDAERITSITRGTLQRASDRRDIVDNGKTGTDRRIDAVSLCRFVLARAQHPELVEKDEHVKRLFTKQPN